MYNITAGTDGFQELKSISHHRKSLKQSVIKETAERCISNMNFNWLMLMRLLYVCNFHS